VDTVSQVSRALMVPRHVPDQRPAADAAASRRIDRPTGTAATPAVPVVAPAATYSGPQASAATQPGAVQPVERVLKPYGVTMLPVSDRKPEAPLPRDSMSESRNEAPATASAPSVTGPVTLDEPTGLDPRARTEGQMAPQVPDSGGKQGNLPPRDST